MSILGKVKRVNFSNYRTLISEAFEDLCNPIVEGLSIRFQKKDSVLVVKYDTYSLSVGSDNITIIKKPVNNEPVYISYSVENDKFYYKNSLTEEIIEEGFLESFDFNKTNYEKILNNIMNILESL